MKKAETASFRPRLRRAVRVLVPDAFGRAPDIIVPMMARLPGSPLRDTSCRCREAGSREVSSGRLRVWFPRGVDRQAPRAHRPGIGRSWQIRSSDSSTSAFSLADAHDLNDAPDSFDCGYRFRYRRMPRRMQCDQTKVILCIIFRQSWSCPSGGIGHLVQARALTKVAGCPLRAS